MRVDSHDHMTPSGYALQVLATARANAPSSGRVRQA